MKLYKFQNFYLKKYIKNNINYILKLYYITKLSSFFTLLSFNDWKSSTSMIKHCEGKVPLTIIMVRNVFTWLLDSLHRLSWKKHALWVSLLHLVRCLDHHQRVKAGWEGFNKKEMYHVMSSGEKTDK